MPQSLLVGVYEKLNTPLYFLLNVQLI